jgi:tripartite-type tricarboxylate transporter receptor subunit TctC
MREPMPRLLVAAAAALLALAAIPAAAQAPYPSKPLRFIVPFPPGGATDIITRVIAQKLSEQVGQPVIVENRPGAGGAIGSDLVAKAAPDGYTLLMATTSTHSIGPTLNPKTPYNVERDFAPVSELATSTNVLVVSPALGVGSVKELIAAAKARPGQLNFASSGTGTIVHLTGELFKSMAGIDVVHVPYKGTALAQPDLMSGQVSMIFDNIVSAMPNLKAGKVKALAVTGRKRSALLPELPTVSEAGVPGFASDAYFAVFVPAATPRPIVERLNAELVKALQNPEVREQLARQGAEPVGGTPAALAATVKAETEKWARVIKQANVKLE